jgi:hypothetical protein
MTASTHPTVTSPTMAIQSLNSILFNIEDDDLAIRDYAAMLAFLTAHPGFETCASSMNRISMLMVDHSKRLQNLHGRMHSIVRRLANP